MDYKKIIILVYIFASISLVVLGFIGILYEKTYFLTAYYPPFIPVLMVNLMFIAGGIFGLMIVYFIVIKEKVINNEKSVKENVSEVFLEK